MEKRSNARGQLTPPIDTSDEVVECMRALRGSVAELKKRWSSRVVMLALATHSSLGIKALIETGDYSAEDAEFLCKDFCESVREAANNVKAKKVADNPT